MQLPPALLLAHVGASHSISEAWIAGLKRRLGLISIGCRNALGNSATEVLARLAGRDVPR